MDAALLERAFVDAHGRMHWPWRLVSFALFAVAAWLVGGMVVYPVVSTVLGVAGVRFVAWPWISLFGIAAAHVLVGRSVDARMTWAQLGLGEAAMAPRKLAAGLGMGAAAILVPVVLCLALGWFAFEVTSDAIWLTSSMSAALVLLPAALFEELLVRGYGFGVIMERFGAIAAVVVSSALFALLHLTNPGATAQSLLAVALAGVWLAMVRLATDSLWAAFAAHFAWKAVMALVLHAKVSGFAFATPRYRMIDTGPAWATGGGWGPEGGAFAALGMVAATAALIARPAGRALFTRPERRGEIRT